MHPTEAAKSGRGNIWPHVGTGRAPLPVLPLLPYISAMTQPPDDAPDAGRFRRTLVRVLSVQVVTLLLLWLLQHRYSR